MKPTVTKYATEAEWKAVRKHGIGQELRGTQKAEHPLDVEPEEALEACFGGNRHGGGAAVGAILHHALEISMMHALRANNAFAQEVLDGA